MPSTSINFDLLARDRASDKFTKVGKAADGTKSKMAALAHAGKIGLGALGVAATAAAGGIGFMVKAAIEDQKSQTKLAQTLKNTTGATKQQIAGVEDWITAQGKAYGVADDDLRPALDKLAVATGSVSKSQKLASLAMNVSAGTGKSLQTVSAALAKGYDGNVGALGRLGIATKDASGHTKTFAQIQGELSKKFAGQAAVAANTFSGRMGRLKLALSEAGEAIGYKLMPIAERMAVWFVNKGLPAIDAFVSFVGTKFGPVFARVSQVVSGQIVPAINQFIGQMRSGQGVGGQVAATFGRVASTLGTVFTWISNNKATVGTFVAIVGTAAAIARVWTVAQLALNFALTANPIGIVVVALAALAAGLVYAYKHSQTFRNIVTGAFQAIRAVAGAVAGFFTSTIPAAFNRVKEAASAAFGWIRRNWPLLLGILTGPFGLAVVLIARNWDRIKSGASAVVGWVRAHWPALLAVLTGPFGLAVAGIARSWGTIKAGASSVKNFIGDRFSDIVGLAKSLPGRISSVLGGAFNGLISSIKTALGWVRSLISAINSIPHPHVSLPKMPHIPGFASGVRNFSGGLAMVGEHGPELVRLRKGSDVYPNVRGTAPMPIGGAGRAGGAAVIEEHYTININGPALDGVEVGRQVELALRRYRRQVGKTDLFA